MKFSARVLTLLFGAIATGAAPHAASNDALAGDWHCPMELRLNGNLPLAVAAWPTLGADGIYRGQADAVMALGQWPLTLRAHSHGRWHRDGEHLHLVVERLELAPGSDVGVELQRQLIRQLEPRLPALPYEETVRIIDDDGYGLVLEDTAGERYACTRVRAGQ